MQQICHALKGKEGDSQTKRILLAAKSLLLRASVVDIKGDLGDTDFTILPKNPNSGM